MIYLLDKYWFSSVKSVHRYYEIAQAYIRRIIQILAHLVLFFLNLLQILLTVLRYDGFGQGLLVRTIRYVEAHGGEQSDELVIHVHLD